MCNCKCCNCNEIGDIYPEDIKRQMQSQRDLLRNELSKYFYKEVGGNLRKFVKLHEKNGKYGKTLSLDVDKLFIRDMYLIISLQQKEKTLIQYRINKIELSIKENSIHVTVHWSDMGIRVDEYMQEKNEVMSTSRKGLIAFINRDSLSENLNDISTEIIDTLVLEHLYGVDNLYREIIQKEENLRKKKNNLR